MSASRKTYYLGKGLRHNESMLGHLRQLFDGQVAHSSECNIVILKEFSHGEKEISGFSRGELLALIRQVNNFAACFGASSSTKRCLKKL